jgi:hypothetical protein
MSANDPQERVQTSASKQYPNPPVGEEIHLPGGSPIPIIVAVGVTLLVIGTTVWVGWSILGFIILVVTITIWVRDVRREVDHLPDDLDAGH